MIRKLLLVVVALAGLGAVLGYGYWWSRTHADLSISVSAASRSQPLTPDPLHIVVALKDASGHVLARARSYGQYNAMTLVEPVEYSCADIELAAAATSRGLAAPTPRRPWLPCIARQSEWIPTWIRRVTTLDLQVKDCVLRDVPAVLDFSSHWLMWWFPFQHDPGGKPSTYVSLSLHVDLERCALRTFDDG